MRFRHSHTSSSLPTLNLTPMLNVMMGILGFFVVVTMLLAADQNQSVDVQLPNAEGATIQDVAQLMIVRLNAQGQILINNQAIARPQLAPQIQAHLSRNPSGFVVLQSDPQVPYQQVVTLLEEMKRAGGDRVSLAVE